MAFCPKCNTTMEPASMICPGCGADYSSVKNGGQSQNGIVYSGLADVILIFGIIVCILSAILSGIGAFLTLLQLLIPACFLYLGSTIVSLALAITFVRIRDMDKTITNQAS